MTDSQVYDSRICALGEGPFWHPERAQLFWFDINARRLLSRQEGQPLEWRFDECVSAAGWIDVDTLIIASETALLRFDINTGQKERLCPLEADNPMTRSNDGRADPFGGFWISTMGKHAEPGQGSIYRYHRGRLTRLFGDITIPNSICFDAFSNHFYFADTVTGRIMRQTLDADGWPSGAPEIFVDLSSDGFNPDGSVVDRDGGLWNAQWGAGRVARYHPDGRFDRAISVAGRHSSCPAFGGPGLETLFVTTATEGMDAPDDQQGATFFAMPDTAGVPESRVMLGPSRIT